MRHWSTCKCYYNSNINERSAWFWSYFYLSEDPIWNVLILAPIPFIFELQALFLFLNMYLVPFWQSLLGAAPVISQEEYDSHSQRWDCGAWAPGGASLLGRLFQGADRLTLKVWCYPQTCHLIQPGSAFSDRKQVRKKTQGYFQVICSLPPLWSHVSFLCILQTE